MHKVMGMIPGMGQMLDGMDDVDAEQDMKRLFGIIDSMTPAEKRRNPTKLIDQSRRRRIAAGAGVEPHEVNELVKQFDAMAQMMKPMAGKGMRERMKMFNQLKGDMMQNPAGAMSRKKQGTGKRLSSKDKAMARKEREKLIKKLRKKKGKK